LGEARSRLWKYGITLLILLLIAYQVIEWRDKLASSENALTVYCATGVRAPVEELAEYFEEKHQQEVIMVYGNSGELAYQINSRSGGDIFIPGDPTFIENITYIERKLLGYQYPVLVLGSDKNRKELLFEDLPFHDLDYVLVDLEMAALGEATRKVLRSSFLGQDAQKQVRGNVSTASQVPMYVSLGAASAGITWYSNYLPYHDELIAVEFPSELRLLTPVKATLLSSSKNKKQAEEFLRLLVSSRGKEAFERYGFVLE